MVAETHFFVCGLSHKSAPLDLREKLAWEEDHLERLHGELMMNEAMQAAMIVSTCNRVEIYGVADDLTSAKERAHQEFAQHLQTAEGGELDFIYIHTGADAIQHLFRVAAGLDSMVLGETQIAGQVKESYSRSVKLSASDTRLSQICHRAFRLSKQVRTETDIQRRPVSVPYAAVVLADQIFGDLSEKKVLLIGAGQMCEVAAQHLVDRNIQQLAIANRTASKADELAEQFNGTTIGWEQISDRLADFDIVLTSTSSQQPIVSANDVEQALDQRRGQPMFFIDIGVPRDIDPKVDQINNAYLFDIDDLQQVVDEGLEERKQAATVAERLIKDDLVGFLEELKNRQQDPAVRDFIKWTERVRQEVVLKKWPTFESLSDAEKEAIERETLLIIKKCRHPYLKSIRQGDQGVDRAEVERIIRQQLRQYQLSS